MRGKVIGILLLFSSQLCLAQSKEKTQASCLQSQEIIIDILGDIIPSTTKDYWVEDSVGRHLVYYPDNEKKSLWYKFIVLKDSRITFSIEPENKGDRYNFFMYKNPGKGSFCENVIEKEIIPLRTNLNNKKSSTGLSEDIDFANADAPEDKWEMMYQKAYHHPIYAKAGEEYYLNVYHVSGGDCGHFFEFKVEGDQKNFRAVRKSCFKENPIKVPSKKAVMDLAELEHVDTKSLKNKIYLRGVLTDSIKKTILSGEVRWTDVISGKTFSAFTKANGEYELVLEGQMLYEITGSSIGYKEKTMRFMKHRFGNETRQVDLELTPLKAGDNFVVHNIYFYPGTYAFKAESTEALNELSSFMKNNSKAKIEIGGHSNGKGFVKKKGNRDHLGPEWNFTGNEKKLSKMRAEAVKDHLVKDGIAENRMVCKGYGAEHMLFPEPKNKSQRDMNKRVELVLLSVGDSSSSASTE